MNSTTIGSSARVEGTVGASEVGPSVLARSGLGPVHYADHFAIRPVDGTSATPERWARVLFGDTPSAAEWFIWRVLLQLRLRRGQSHSTVAGWRIAARSEDWIRLETASWMMAAELVIRASTQEVSLSTLVRYERGAAAAVWGTLSAVHRRLVPGVLREAATTVAVQTQ